MSARAQSEDDDNRALRKDRLSVSLSLGRRKKKKSDALDPYRKFVAFYTRSENPFVNYYLVLDVGMAWEASQFGELSRDEFCAENAKLLHVYRQLRSGVPQFTQDFYELLRDSEIEALQKQLNDVVTSARGADIHSLRERGISYIELEQPDKQLIPRIDPAASKSSLRGHNHPVLSRLLCPVKYLADFDANPAEFQTKLRNNKVRVTAGDFPALLYPYDGFDPDDLESGLFHSPILLRFYKHIFTAPSSARQDLQVTGSRPKIKRPQAMLNNMKVVTPGSIAYAALMFRHCISSLDDWRTEDDLFKRDEFFDSMVSILDDPDDEWVKDTMKWWNSHVFGSLYTSDDEQEEEPSTADLLQEKRAARKARQSYAQHSPMRTRTPDFLGHPPLPQTLPSGCDSNPQHLQQGHSFPHTQPLNPAGDIENRFTPSNHHGSLQHPGQSGPASRQNSTPSTMTEESSESRGRYPKPGSDRPRYQPPLQPHDDNVPHASHSSNQLYRHRDHAPPARNRERSRSPPHLQKSSTSSHHLPVGQDYRRRDSSPVGPPSQVLGRHHR